MRARSALLSLFLVANLFTLAWGACIEVPPGSTCDSLGSYFYDYVNETHGVGVAFPDSCSPTNVPFPSETVWGSNPYTSDSGILEAVMHLCGSFQGMSVYMSPTKNSGTGFVGSESNGVTTSPYPEYEGVTLTCNIDCSCDNDDDSCGGNDDNGNDDNGNDDNGNDDNGSDDNGNDDNGNDDNGNDDNGNDDNNDDDAPLGGGSDDDDDGASAGTTTASEGTTTASEGTTTASAVTEQLEGLERLADELGEDINKKKDLAALSVTYSFLNAVRAADAPRFEVTGADKVPLETPDNGAGGGRGRLAAAALLASLGLMAVMGLLLFLARRSRPSSRRRAVTSPTAPAEVKPRVMKSDDTPVVVD